MVDAAPAPAPAPAPTPAPAASGPALSQTGDDFQKEVDKKKAPAPSGPAPVPSGPAPAPGSPAPSGPAPANDAPEPSANGSGGDGEASGSGDSTDIGNGMDAGDGAETASGPAPAPSGGTGSGSGGGSLPGINALASVPESSGGAASSSGAGDTVVDDGVEAASGSVPEGSGGDDMASETGDGAVPGADTASGGGDGTAASGNTVIPLGTGAPFPLDPVFGNALQQAQSLAGSSGPDAPQSPTSPFFEASRKGDVETVQALLEQSATGDASSGLNINAVDENGNNALQIAVGANVKSHGIVEVITLLANAGVDVLHENDLGETAREIAGRGTSWGYGFAQEKATAVTDGEQAQFLRSIYQGTEDRSIAFLERETGSGRSAQDLLNMEVAPGVNVLMWAAGNDNQRTVQALVDAIPDPQKRMEYVNRKGPDGHTASHMAVRDDETRGILKEAGADDGVENDAGDTPTELLGKRGTVDWWDKEENAAWNLANLVGIGINDLLNGIPTGYGSSTYEPAASPMATSAPPAMPSPPDPSQEAADAFHAAVRRGDVAAVRTFLAEPPAGYDINAAGSHAPVLHEALTSASAHELIPLLVEHGADPAARHQGESAFTAAVARATGAEGQELRGTAQYLRDALTRRMRHELLQGEEAPVLTLIEAGAAPDGRFANGATFLSLAAFRGMTRTVEALVAQIPEDNRPAVINTPDARGNTSLHWAAAGGQRDLLHELTGLGGDPEARNQDEEPARPDDLLPAIARRSDPMDMDLSMPSGWSSEDLITMSYDDAWEGINFDEIPDLNATFPIDGAPMEWEAGEPQQPNIFSNEMDALTREISQALVDLPEPLSAQVEREEGGLRARIGNLDIRSDPVLSQDNQEAFVRTVALGLRDMAQSRGFAGPDLLQDLVIRDSGPVIRQGDVNSYDAETREIITTGQPGLAGMYEPNLEPDPLSNIYDVDDQPGSQPPFYVDLHFMLNAWAYDEENRPSDEPPMVVELANGNSALASYAYAQGLGDYVDNQHSNNILRMNNGIQIRSYMQSMQELDDEGRWGAAERDGPAPTRPNHPDHPVDVFGLPAFAGIDPALLDPTAPADDNIIIKQIERLGEEIKRVANEQSALNNEEPLDMSGNLSSKVYSNIGPTLLFSFNNGIVLAAGQQSTTIRKRYSLVRSGMREVLAMVGTRAGRAGLRQLSNELSKQSQGSNKVTMYTTDGLDVRPLSGVNYGTAYSVGVSGEGGVAGERMMEAVAMAAGVSSHELSAKSFMHYIVREKYSERKLREVHAAGRGLGPYAEYDWSLNAYLTELGHPVRAYISSQDEITDGHWLGVDPAEVHRQVAELPQVPEPDTEEYADAYYTAWKKIKRGRGRGKPSKRDLPDHEISYAGEEDRAWLVDELVSGLTERGAVAAGRLPALSDPALRHEFKSLVGYHLFHQDQSEGEDPVAPRYRELATATAIRQIGEGLEKAGPDAAAARQAREQWEAHAAGEQSTTVDELAGEAWDDYLAALNTMGSAPRDAVPEATHQDYEDGLNALARGIFKGMDFGQETMTSLTDPALAPLFNDLMISELNRNAAKTTAGQKIDEKVMYEALDKVVTALGPRIWNEANTSGKADEAARIFSTYWDEDNPDKGRGSDQADRLARQAWEQWLEANDLEGSPNILVDKLIDEGHSLIDSEEDYFRLLNDGDPDTHTIIDPEHDVRDGYVRVVQFDDPVAWNEEGRSNRQYVFRLDTADEKKLAGEDLAFQEKLGEEFDFGDVFRKRFQDTGSLTPGMREAADHFLRIDALSTEQTASITRDLNEGGWTAEQIQAVLDSEVLYVGDFEKNWARENHAKINKVELDKAMRAELEYLKQPSPSSWTEQDFDGKLNEFVSIMGIKSDVSADSFPAETSKILVDFDDPRLKSKLRNLILYELHGMKNPSDEHRTATNNVLGKISDRLINHFKGTALGKKGKWEFKDLFTFGTQRPYLIENIFQQYLDTSGRPVADLIGAEAWKRR